MQPDESLILSAGRLIGRYVIEAIQVVYSEGEPRPYYTCTDIATGHPKLLDTKELLMELDKKYEVIEIINCADDNDYLDLPTPEDFKPLDYETISHGE